MALEKELMQDAEYAANIILACCSKLNQLNGIIGNLGDIGWVELSKVYQEKYPLDLNKLNQYIGEAIEKMAAASEAGEDYEQFDFGFHLAMAETLRNSVLRRVYPVIFEAIEQGYRRTAHVHGSSRVALSYHREIMDAIERGDALAASESTRRHICQALNDINRNVEGDSQS